MEKKIQLSFLYQNHMIIQREKPVVITGEAFGITELKAVLGERSGECRVENGRFTVTLDAMEAAKGLSLEFYADGGNEAVLRIEDISVGDIYLACGQSNMEFFLMYDAHYQDVIRRKKNPDLHMFNVPQVSFEGDDHALTGPVTWFTDRDSAWRYFSAPGYECGRILQETLGIPVGVIGCNWGGTPACAWMGEKWLEKEPLTVFNEEYRQAVEAWDPEELEAFSKKCLAFENSYAHAMEWRSVMYGLTAEEQEVWTKEHEGSPELPMGPFHHYRPSGLYHTMLSRLHGFAVKGILWYQGESDSGHADIYDETMKALIGCFREDFNDPDLPFLFVQLAPFGKWLGCTSDNYHIVREKQDLVTKTVSGTACACVMDLGSYWDIHPKHKMEVGERLALLALGHVYGKEGVFDSPELRSVKREGTKIELAFDYAGTGLRAEEYPEELILLLGDKKIEPESVAVENDRMTITLPDSPDGPVSIRYACEDYCEVHVKNSAGLPVRPFLAQC